MIRDYALAASGLLVRKLGGPTSSHISPRACGRRWRCSRATRDYKTGLGRKLYRRSLYTFWKRGRPPAALDILNAPSREICAVRRDVPTRPSRPW